MLKLLYFLLLFFIFCFDRVVTTTWSHKPYLSTHMQFQKEDSSNRSFLPIEAGGLDIGTIVNHYAIYESLSSNFSAVLYGGMSTLDVYEFNLKEGQVISAEMWVANFQEDHVDNVNVVQAGWTILPSIYGDSKTHFFVAWTADGYKSSGCLDLNCDGFVPVNNAPITPGDTLEGQRKISIKIFKNKDDGDWWLHFAHDGENFTRVGFWPKSIFNSLVDHANSVQWGGYTHSAVRDPSPPMGNGHSPGEENSAAFQGVQFVNNNGQGYDPPPGLGGIFPVATHAKCYGVSALTNNKFHYGGPGGCTSP